MGYMFRWWNDPGVSGAAGVHPRIGPAALIGLFLLGSCAVIDLRPIGVETIPREPYEVLEDYYTPVVLSFDTEMVKTTAQQAISVSFSRGVVEGDLRWQGNTLYFTPAAGWIAGRRYTLSLTGEIYAADGRELRLARYLPFFAVSRAELPRLDSFSPADGASVGVTAEDGGTVILNFSLPMDRRSVEEGFSLDGAGNKKFEWDGDDRILRVRTDKPLSPWTTYHWSLDQALSREGAPLAKPVSAQFTTDLDRSHPVVLEVFPLLRGDPPETTAPVPELFPPWVRTGADMENGLGSGQGIGVRFNKPMDEESMRKAIRLEPSLSGNVEILSPSSLVYVPDRDPEAETRYTLTVSGDTQDTSGLRMGVDFICYFTPDIPFLRIPSLSVNGQPPLAMDAGDGSGYYAFPLEGITEITGITLEFSLPFSPEAMVATVLEISLDPWFPASLGSAVLKAAAWSSEDTLFMEWEGLEPGTPGEPHFYRLTIPGGKSGISNGQGSCLKDTQHIYMEVLDS
ncbi:Ig-like domain-containing protein [Treponema sp. TIM-1]|uniref:Ig-like domain-containing protein n=1 Tax=Treponema sp. TIM-1 TaxID=2898417 RepID=UPI003980C1FF